MLKPVWRTTKINVHTKIKILSNYVLSVLIYGAKCSMTTVAIQGRLEVIQTKGIRRFQLIYLPIAILNEELRSSTGIDTLGETIQTRRWLTRTCLPNTLLLHHQNSPQMKTSGQEKNGTTRCVMAAN